MAALNKIPPPTKQKDLLAFLGAANFWRRSLGGLHKNQKYHNAASLLQCLYTIATEKGLNSKKFVQKWNQDPKYLQAFNDAKELLTKAANLTHMNPNKPLALFADASDTSIGGTLCQKGQSGWLTVGYYSKSLTESQRKWSVFRKELYSLFMSCRHFLPEILGRELFCFSDHKSLVDAFKRPELKLNDSVATRQLLELSQFTRSIQHIEGTKNAGPDFLSRMIPPKPKPQIIETKDAFETFNPLMTKLQNNAESNSKQDHETSQQEQRTAKIQTTLGDGYIALTEIEEKVQIDTSNVESIAEAQKECPETLSAKQGKHQKQATFANIKINGHNVYCEMSHKKPRPLIPAKLRISVIKKLHSTGHPNEKETLYRVASQFYWNKMQSAIKDYCKKCHQCLSVKPNKQKTPHIGKFEVPDDRFTHLVVDIIELPKASDGNKYCFTVVCRTTRYFSCYPMKTATTENCLAGLLDFIGHFGIPLYISSDSGTQFISNLWKKLETTLGIELKKGPFYRPQAVGMVERAHQTFKNALKTKILDFANKNQKDWPQLIHWALLSMRASFRDDIQASPAELAHGLKPALPGSLILTHQPNQDLKTLLENVKTKTDRKAVQTKINVENKPVQEPPADVTHAYTLQHNTTGLDPSYRGPFEIVKRISRSTVRLKVGQYASGEMRTEDRHWGQLKAVKLPKTTIPDSRPKLGRPTVKQSEQNSKPTPSTGPPPTPPFTGFKPSDIKPKEPIITKEMLNSWGDIYETISSIDFTKPPPPITMWQASSKEIASINSSITNRISMVRQP